MEQQELPEYIRIGMDRFYKHPAVEAPVGFDDAGVRSAFTFRSKVGLPHGAEQVERSGSTPDDAWLGFEIAMSDAISRAAGAEGTDLTGE